MDMDDKTLIDRVLPKISLSLDKPVEEH